MKRYDSLAILCVFLHLADLWDISLLLKTMYTNTQRLVQLSQANAKLSSDGANSRVRLVDADEATEKLRHELEVGESWRLVFMCTLQK